MRSLPILCTALALLGSGAAGAQTVALTHDTGSDSQQLADVDAGGNIVAYGTGIAGCCDVAGALASLADDEVILVAEDEGATTQTLHVLDTDTGDPAGSAALPAGERLLGLRWDDVDTRLLALARPDGGTELGLRSVNPATGATQAIGNPIADCCAVAVGVDVLDADNDVWYVVARLTTGSDWRLLAIDTSDGSVLSQPVLADIPVALLLDGAQVLAVHHDAGTQTLATVNTATGALTDIGSGLADCCHAAAGVISHGDSGLLFMGRPVSGGAYTLYAIDPATGDFTSPSTVPASRPVNALFDLSGATGPQIKQGSLVGVNMDEDGAPTAFALTLNASDPAMGGLSWTIDEGAGQGMASVSTGTGLSQAINYSPNPDYNGTDTFVVQVADTMAETDLIRVNVTIDPVNDAPTLSLAGDQVVEDLDGQQIITGFATASVGPANESAQTLSVNVTDVTNPGLFNLTPVLNSAGDLLYTPAQNASGQSVVEVTAMDDGGTAGGGVDTTVETFTVTVTLTPRADVAAGMTVSAANADPGDVLVYTLTVSNGGPEDVVDVMVDNPLPPQLGNASWTCSADVGSNCGTANGAGGVMDDPDIQAGDDITYTLTATITGSEGEDIPVIAEALPPTDPVDTVTNNNLTAVLTFIGMFRDGFEPDE